MRMITLSMKAVAAEPFDIENTAWSPYVTCPEWKPTKRIGRGDAWLEIVEFARDEQDHTWLAAAVGSAGTELNLELMFRDGLSGYFAKLEADQSLAAKLRKKGFKIDTANRRVYLPIVIKPDLLAKALPSDDKFDEAMAPVREATELGIAAVPRAEAIARLNDQLRKTATGGTIMVTKGVLAISGYNSLELAEALAAYDAFDAENDAHGERDFGDLTLWGEEIFWKIDYHDVDLKFGSDDPADPNKTKRVLTVMLMSEW